MKRNSQQGVALVITLILLSAITFMAVTFLVVSRRERERTTVQSNQSDATFAANAAIEQAKNQIVSLMLARTNGLDSGLLVSTNYISPVGFTSGVSSPTNVSYYYPNGTPIRGNDLLVNLTNMLYLPRVPVFVTTNQGQYSGGDFRYYYDANRNGRYDPNGWTVETNSLGLPIQIAGTNVLGYHVGDPEWVGILDHPDQHYSSSNRYVARYAFMVLPTGNSLDFNYIHNQAKEIGVNQDGFLRDQGVGSWELNLAAFLYTLDTNIWGATTPPYSYSTNLYTASLFRDLSFDDARQITAYRYNWNYNNLIPVRTALGQPGVNAFQNDYIDEVLHGRIWTTATSPQNDSDPSPDLRTRPWVGSDNQAHYYSPQDLFSPTFSQHPAPGVPGTQNFSNHLYSAGTSNASYERYTFYRMLSQIGFESAPNGNSNRMNLNYMNVDANGNAVSVTNFVAWPSALMFFTNAANRLLVNAGYNFNTGLIPVYDGIGSNFLYTPAIQRLLQLAANMYDASTNRLLAVSPKGVPYYYPSVFSPRFITINHTNYINRFVEEVNNNYDWLPKPLTLPNDTASVGPNTVNIYGVPWIIGAKKGFPNFNEYSAASYSQITRKIQIVKKTAGDNNHADWLINQKYVVGISNVIGVEAWNSYQTNYALPFSVIASAEISMLLTNDQGYRYLAITNVGATNYFPSWPGFVPGSISGPSFQIPINNANFIFMPDSSWYQSLHNLIQISANEIFDPGNPNYIIPHFWLMVTNKLRYIMTDAASGRVLDYVAFNPPTVVRDLNSELSLADPLQLWNTNKLKAGLFPGMPTGIQNQISVAKGDIGSAGDWVNAMVDAPSAQSVAASIQAFTAFYNGSSANTNTVMQVPFSPTVKYSSYLTYQANDPLVHYTLGDLTEFPQTNILNHITPPNAASSTNALANLGILNDRYRPWGGNPRQSASADTNAWNLAIKDPLIWYSDSWDFPTNKFPNVGWLGRVHRGTPWQTVYLKSSAIDSNSWQTWSGNPDPLSAGLTQPTNDWKILDLFTAAPNDNASRGQLSVNQTNMAAWAAVLQGVVTLTNTAVAPSSIYSPYVISPVADAASFQLIVNSINQARTNFYGGVFAHLGDVLAAPLLTVNSPFLNTSTVQQRYGIGDEAYERIPQQIMSLLKLGEARYVIYGYGQSLKPADRSVVQSGGPFFGMVTNYQITGEAAVRAVVRIDNAPQPPTYPGTYYPTPPAVVPPARVVIESFNVIPP